MVLIPEAIAFSIIVGVEPEVRPYASFSITVLVAFVGGRPKMISAATAATAAQMVTLARDSWLNYLLAATVPHRRGKGKCRRRCACLASSF